MHVHACGVPDHATKRLVRSRAFPVVPSPAARYRRNHRRLWLLQEVAGIDRQAEGRRFDSCNAHHCSDCRSPTSGIPLESEEAASNAFPLHKRVTQSRLEHHSLVGSDPASRRRQGHAQFVIRARTTGRLAGECGQRETQTFLAASFRATTTSLGAQPVALLGSRGHHPHTRRNANTRPRHRVSELPAELVPQTWSCAAASDADHPHSLEAPMAWRLCFSRHRSPMLEKRPPPHRVRHAPQVQRVAPQGALTQATRSSLPLRSLRGRATGRTNSPGEGKASRGPRSTRPTNGASKIAPRHQSSRIVVVMWCQQ